MQWTKNLMHIKFKTYSYLTTLIFQVHEPIGTQRVAFNLHITFTFSKKLKTPKVEVVKPEAVKKVEDYQVMNDAVKVEKKETANVTKVLKKEESVKVNVGCGGGASCR